MRRSQKRWTAFLLLILCFIQIYLLEVSVGTSETKGDKCNLKSNKSCEDCVQDGCTFCGSENSCVTFSLVNDTLNNKCKNQDWYFKQCFVNGKSLLIAVPVTVFVVLVLLVCCCCCCCCKGKKCRGCGKCIRNIFCCCCCCCDENRSSSSGKSHGLLSGVKNPMTRSAASRIQSATARLYGGVSKGSFSSRAQSTADRRAYWGIY